MMKKQNPGQGALDGAKENQRRGTFITDNTPTRARRQIKNLITAAAVHGLLPIGPAYWILSCLEVKP